MTILTWIKPFLNLKILIIIILIIAGVGGTGYFYTNYQKSQSELQRFRNDPKELVKEENKRLIETVGKLVELPKGEDPIIATVNDIRKLKGQPFFIKALNGDKVLIYTKAKEAILYRPSTNKIIEIAPVNLGEGKSKSATSSATKP